MNKLNLILLLWEKLSKNKQKELKIKGKKQVDALVALKPKEIKPRETKPNKYGDYFLNGLAKIRESYEPVDLNDVTYNFKDLRIPSVSFFKFKGPMHVFESICKADITLEDIEKEQIELKKDLDIEKEQIERKKDLVRIKQGDPKDKKKTTNNIKNLYNSREEVFQMFNDYAKNMSKNIYESKQGTGLKILIPKQMLHRLPIALAQLKAGKNSESLLNEIRQIVYYLHQSKKNYQKSL